MDLFSIQGAHFRQFAYSVGVQIIHMNGRIYDPTLGRFLQADPFIQAPNDSQSFNRYSYVLDNPMTMTDPSGYISLNPFKKITRAVIKGLSKVFGKNLVQSLGNIASLACGPAAPACSGYWNCEFARAHGVSSSGALRGAFTAAIGTYVNASDGLSGYGTFAINSAINNIAEKNDTATVRKTVGETHSSVTGGKFANGAITDTFAQTFNREPAARFTETKKAVNSAIASKDYEKAVALATDYLGQDASSPTAILIEPNTVGNVAASVSKDGVLSFYRDSFSSAERLISTVGHEYVHVQQWQKGLIVNKKDNPQQWYLNELEGTQWEIDNVHLTGYHNGMDQNLAFKAIYFNRLTAENQSNVMRGIYESY